MTAVHRQCVYAYCQCRVMHASAGLQCMKSACVGTAVSKLKDILVGLIASTCQLPLATDLSTESGYKKPFYLKASLFYFSFEVKFDILSA